MSFPIISPALSPGWYWWFREAQGVPKLVGLDHAYNRCDGDGPRRQQGSGPAAPSGGYPSPFLQRDFTYHFYFLIVFIFYIKLFDSLSYELGIYEA